MRAIRPTERNRKEELLFESGPGSASAGLGPFFILKLGLTIVSSGGLCIPSLNHEMERLKVSIS